MARSDLHQAAILGQQKTSPPFTWRERMQAEREHPNSTQEFLPQTKNSFGLKQQLQPLHCCCIL